MSFTLPIDRICTLSISPVDAHGNPAPVDGAPVWAVSDANLLVMTPAEDGMSAVLSAVGALGTAQVTVTADALLGPEVHNLTGLLEVTVVGGEAVSLNITPGELRPAA